MSIYRRKDSGTWWANYINASGKRVRRSTETSNRKEAAYIAVKWETEARHARLHGVPESRTFEEVMLEFLRYSKDNKRSYKADIVRTRALQAYFADMVINKLTKADIHAYINKRRAEVSNSTINREISLLSAAINYCNNILDWQLPNKITGLKLREPQGRVRWITEEEAEGLIAAASESSADYLPDFITLALHTGCRSSELLQLTWQQVDLKQDLILLEQTKSGKRRSVPINQKARQALLKRLSIRTTHYPDAKRVFVSKRTGKGIDCVKKSFATACRKAGLSDFHIHDMRHTCAAWLVKRGVPLIVVRDLLGHSSVKTTEIYAHLAPDNVRAGVALLEDGHGSVTFNRDDAVKKL